MGSKHTRRPDFELKKVVELVVDILHSADGSTKIVVGISGLCGERISLGVLAYFTNIIYLNTN